MADIQTNVQEIDLDIDSWLGAPGADSIVTPTGGEKPEAKPHMFSSTKQDLSFLDTSMGTKEKELPISKDEAKLILDEVLDEDLKTADDDNIIDKKSAGRPKTDKSGLVEFLKKRIEAKEMFAFDDFDDSKQELGDYLSNLGEKDIEDLWQANISNIKEEVASQTPQEFFKSLPEELQYAAKYVADGGQDLKGLFAALAQVEQVREMNPTDENDQEYIVRQYLQAKGVYGSAEEMEEEITTWKDLGVLEKKAKQFKPKLDQMQEQIVRSQLAQQEKRNQQQQAAADAYIQNVFETLRPGEINGLKLDKKTQAQLYSGLVQPQYPSISGRPTNLLGHLLEKYQYVEPNYSLIAEALWLLSNPEDYRNSLKKVGGNEKVEQTVRQLKTEQSRKNVAASYEEDDDKPKRIARPQNIFKR